MWNPLGDVAQVLTGYPFRKKVETEDGGDIVLVQIKDIDGTEGVSGTGAVVLRSDGGKYNRHLLQEGDLLFQSRGSRHPVAVVGAGIRGLAATGLHVIRANTDQVMPGYLAWWLSHPQSQAKLIRDVARGTYIPFVSKGDLESFLIVVPPLAVQARIIEVDSLHRRERALEARLEQLTKQLVDAATWTAATRKK